MEDRLAVKSIRHWRRVTSRIENRCCKHLFLIVAVFFITATIYKTAFADGCKECHSGVGKRSSSVTALPSSTHSELECTDCHAGVETPHTTNVYYVQCKTCHSDEIKTVEDSSHSKKLLEWLNKNKSIKPATICLVCHGGDAHNVKKTTDATSTTNRVNIPSTCLNCHKEVQPIAIDKYLYGVHSSAVERGKTQAAVCTDCHNSHSINHSKLSTSKVFHTTVPQTCGQCHPNEYTEYTNSVHWSAVSKGFREAPVCIDCHGEHGIRSPRDSLSPVWAGNITKMCASCHDSEKLTSKFMIPADRVESFSDSFHGLSGRLGDVKVANCASCHGSHKILPSSDTRSPIHPNNLSKTCGKCHPGAESRFISGKIHSTTQKPSHWIVDIVRKIYIWIIAITIGGMLLHNLLDLICKAKKETPYRREEALIPRFSVTERIQHSILAICFILLAISGFALKFPDSPLAWPFQLFSCGAVVRRWVHIGCATAFIGLSIYHLFYLMSTSRGRGQLKLLKPRWQDLRDAKNVIIRYFNSSAASVKLPHYSYMEKTEYWALIWGSIIMTITGLLLYFVNVTLSNLPLWVTNLATTIHFWEAVLATLAIAVWHGYWVVFDPEVYPLNLTWLTGQSHTVKRESKL